MGPGKSAYGSGSQALVVSTHLHAVVVAQNLYENLLAIALNYTFRESDELSEKLLTLQCTGTIGFAHWIGKIAFVKPACR